MGWYSLILLRRGGIVSVVRTFQILSILIGPKLFLGVHMAQEGSWNVLECSRRFSGVHMAQSGVHMAQLSLIQHS